jgi:ribosomal protein S18 acetylase RimI-like enzyme
MSPTDEALLDNPAYSALCGPHAKYAEVRGRVRQYEPDVAPFLAMPAPPSAQDWRDAAALIAPGALAAVLSDGGELGDGWMLTRTFDLQQMVGERVTGAECAEAVSLGAADVPEMLALVAETEPGPFLPRTVELGDYLGIRRDGVLVAMAGERLRFDGWTEISGVCTKPGHRGAGLASQLIGALIAGIQRRSERPFLHVLATNTGAIRIYEGLGFRVRQTATIVVAMPPPAASS